MMERKRKFYSDIVLALELIEEFTSDTQTFEEYSNDFKTKSAVERQLVIIGEAVNSLRKLDANELGNADQIISFRNRLVHSYDSIEDSIVWVILKRHLSPFKNEI